MGDTLRGKRFRFGVGVRWHNKAVIHPLPNGDHNVFYHGDKASESAMFSPTQSSEEWQLLTAAPFAPAGSAALTPNPNRSGPRLQKFPKAFEDVAPMFVDRTKGIQL